LGIVEKVEQDLDDNEDEPKIGYQFSILSLAQLQLSKARREPAARYAEISSTMPWDDLKDQLKIRIVDVLFPQQVNIADGAFEIAASVARHLPDPVPLITAADYEMIKKHALKMKEPVVKIFVKQILSIVRVTHIS
jgi:hypothetical protein